MNRTNQPLTPLESTQQALDFIQSDTLSSDQLALLNQLTVDGFRQHVNPGFLEYRKSVTSGGGYAAVEWRATSLNTLADTRGNEYIDCLGG